jgi:hypothetical protein
MFLFDDGTGQGVVQPEGAQVTTTHYAVWTESGYRKHEWLLLPGDSIIVLGDFRSLTGTDLSLNSSQDISDLLADWKADRPNLLARFDLNQDGQLDMQEWELARSAARRQVLRDHEARRAAFGEQHAVVRPKSGRPFLISNRSEPVLSTNYGWWAALYVAFFIASLVAIPLSYSPDSSKLFN